MSESEFLKQANHLKFKLSEVSENEIETKFVNYAKSKKCLALKLVLFNKRGFPDRTVVCPNGIIFFIEFKRKNKPLSGPQEKIKQKLKSVGARYFICDEVGQAEKILDEMVTT